jgi:hypothetical protein
VGGELITSTHLPLIVTVKIAMRHQPPPPKPRPALRTSKISATEIKDLVNTVAEKLSLAQRNKAGNATRTPLQELHDTVFNTGKDVVGLKGNLKPTKYSKKDTRTGRLRQQLVALDMADDLLRSQHQATEHWPMFENHFRPKLPAEIDVEFTETQNDSSRDQKRAEVKALANRVRREIARVEEQLRRESNQSNGVSFREAYRPYMQQRRSAGIDHTLLRNSITAEITELTSKEEVQSHLLEAL